MGIPLSSQYSLNTPLPLDDRDVATNITARNSIASGRRYDGLACYVVADKSTYQLQGGVTNADWVLIGGTGTGGSSGPDLTQYTSISDDGNLTITLRAKVKALVLEDDMAVKWLFTSSIGGAIILDNTATADALTEIILIRDDNVQVSLKILNGVLVSDTVIGAGELIQNLYLQSPNGMAWKVRVAASGVIYLESGFGNSFRLKDELDNTLFKVSQGADGTMHESKPYTTPLPTPTPEGNNAPWAFEIVNGEPVMKVWNGTEWLRVLTGRSKDPFAVGSIQKSLLTEAEFRVEMDDPNGDRWKLWKTEWTLPNGCRLKQIKGWSTLPDARGVVLRNLDEDAVRDVQVGIRSKHEGQLLASYQKDEVGPHTHYMDWAMWFNDNGGYHGPGPVQKGHIGRRSDGYGTDGTYNFYANITMDENTGKESRMKNLAVNYFIKYNR